MQLGMANGQRRTLRAKGYVRHLDRQIRRTIPLPTCRIMTLVCGGMSRQTVAPKANVTPEPNRLGLR